MDTNPFHRMDWVKLIETLLSFKKNLSKANRKEWDVRSWQEICDQMKWMQMVCTNSLEDIRIRQQVCNRLLGAKITSYKIRNMDPYTKEPSFQGRPGVVSAIFEGRFDRQGAYFHLPHVEVTFSEDEKIFHRLEDLRLTIEPWWFSHSEHKPPKK